MRSDDGVERLIGVAERAAVLFEFAPSKLDESEAQARDRVTAVRVSGGMQLMLDRMDEAGIASRA